VTADLVEPQGGVRRSRLPWILLALSLALNLCFVGGLFWVRMEASRARMGPPERMELVAKQLALDDNQRAAFDRFVRTMRLKSRHLRETNMPLIDDTWQEFAKQQPDEAAIDKLSEQAANNRRSFQIETGRALREFLAALSEDQRTKFIALVKNRDRDRPPLLRQLMQ
jgi:uncharacterized membrane protein